MRPERTHPRVPPVSHASPSGPAGRGLEPPSQPPAVKGSQGPGHANVFALRGHSQRKGTEKCKIEVLDSQVNVFQKWAVLPGVSAPVLPGDSAPVPGFQLLGLNL